MKGSDTGHLLGVVIALLQGCQSVNPAIEGVAGLSLPQENQLGESRDGIDWISPRLEKHLRSAKREVRWEDRYHVDLDWQDQNYWRIRFLEDETMSMKTNPLATMAPNPTPSTTISTEPAAPTMSPIPSDQPSMIPSTMPSTIPCEDFPRDEYISLRLSEVTDILILLDRDTPQGKAFEYILADGSLDPCNATNLEQKFSLASIFFATQGDDWITRTGWLEAPNECDWYQVSCDGVSNVVNLTLVNNELNGTIPEEVTALTSLQMLDMSQNYLSGMLPRGLEKLSGNLLALRLARNSFEGIVPEALGRMTFLRELVLSDNLFSGSLPSSLFRLEALQSLRVDTNAIAGSLPTDILLPELSVFHASRNRLVGPIPGALWNSTMLTSLQLANNAFTGELSGSISNLVTLAHLDLSANVLTGTLPILLGRLSTLTVLSLGDNNFNGTLRDVFSTFDSLERIDLSGNALTGPIPSGLFDLASITNIALHNNALEGQIPDKWENAVVLSSLALYNNRLTGSVPQVTTGSFQSLISVLLHGNQLTGSMPPSVCELRFETLDILWTDCGSTANPRIACDAPACCTMCFPAEQRSYGLQEGY